MTAGMIIQKPEMVIVGFREKLEPRNGIGAIWRKLYRHVQENGLDLSQVQQIGMIFKVEEDNTFDYMAGFIAPSIEVAKVTGMDAAVVQSSEFAIGDVQGAIPECIMGGVNHLVNNFIPSQGYKPAGPVMEAYAPEGNPNDRSYQMQVWIPVKKEEA